MNNSPTGTIREITTNSSQNTYSTESDMSRNNYGMTEDGNLDWLRERANSIGYNDVFAWVGVDYDGDPEIEIALVGSGGKEPLGAFVLAGELSDRIGIEVKPYAVSGMEHFRSVFGDVPLIKAA